ncbi:tyrosine-protein kinase SYK-like [Amphiura filiformis]|uniref:tyrosine-protein kinase SYK-like n=1 Tax=Amphiura filiformis TaxID=82378 RepID=UPI003B2279E0
MSHEKYESIPAADPHKVRYYHGRLTREEAEKRLTEGGLIDGLYLLRDHLFHDAYYVLSMYYEGVIRHYVIVRNFQDGTVSLIGSERKFTGPIELVSYYSRNSSSLHCQLKKPCLLPIAVSPTSFAGLSPEELKQEMISIGLMHKLSKDEIRKTLSSPKRPEFERLTRKFLHQKRSWFHGAISKKIAEKRLKLSGYREGSFLMWLKSKTRTYYLSLCYKESVIHYKITMQTVLGQVSIAARESKYFDSLLALVDYHEKQKEILANLLSDPCDVKEYKEHSIHETQILITGPMPAVFKKILEIDDLDSIKFANRGSRPRFVAIEDGLESVSKAATSNGQVPLSNNNKRIEDNGSSKTHQDKEDGNQEQSNNVPGNQDNQDSEDDQLHPPPVSSRVIRNEPVNGNQQSYTDMVHMASRFRSTSIPPLDPIRENAEEETTSVVSRVSSISSSVEAIGPVIANPQGNYRLCLIRVPENQGLETLPTVSRTPTSDYQSSETSSFDNILLDSANNTVERQSHRQARERRDTKVHFEE